MACLLVTIVYAGVWLALAMLFSIIFRSAATAALVALGHVALPHDPVAAALAVSGLSVRVGYGRDSRGIVEPFGRAAGFRPAVARRLVRRDRRRAARSDGAFDPATAPGLTGLGPGATGSVPGAPLPLLQSIEVAWPQTVGMIAGAILLFVIGYVIFQRQEVRA